MKKVTCIKNFYEEFTNEKCDRLWLRGKKANYFIDRFNIRGVRRFDLCRFYQKDRTSFCVDTTVTTNSQEAVNAIEYLVAKALNAEIELI